MKRTFLYLATILTAACASAEPLTPARALARINIAGQTDGSARRIASRALVDATPALTVCNHSKDAELYLFTPADGGMLLVSAESETPALIGYSDRFISGAELPPALQMMIEGYAAEIAALRAGDVIYGNDAHASRADDDLPTINPLCSTLWNQDDPYNRLCPKLSGYTSVTGCVATAMAQVLKVYEYPEKCSGGTFSYNWQSGGSTLSLNFDDVTLDWDNMADTYSQTSSDESRTAVATLMMALGYSARMEYNPSASGATGYNLTSGLVRNFDYDCTLAHYSRSWFTRPQWQKMVYDVLASGYPVYYDGATADNTMGHAFVVDGYGGANYFHINWGWGGMSDGYFLLTALDPGVQGIGGASASFDREQGAIFGLKKGRTTASADAPYHFCIDKGFSARISSAALGTSVSFKFTAEYNATYNVGPLTAANALPAVKLTKSDGTVYNLYPSNYGSVSIPPLYGIDPPSNVIIPTSLTEGKYTVTPAIYNTSSKKFYDVYYPIGQGGSFEAEVTGGKIYFSSSTTATLTASELKAPETIYTRKAFSLTGKFIGDAAESYHGPVKAYLRPRGQNTRKADLGTFIADVEPGENAFFSVKLVLTDNLIVSGEYDIALIDQNNKPIAEGTIPVTLVAPDSSGQLKASGLTCTSATREELAFEVTLTASDGNFKGPVYIQVHNRGDYKNYVVDLESPAIEIKNGEKKTITVSGTFDEGVIGSEYTAYVHYYRDDVLTEALGRQRLNFTLTDGNQDAIDAVRPEPADSEVEFFDLSGRRVTRPGKGIYILRQGALTTKVRL